MSEITIFLLYLLASAAFASSRLPRLAAGARPLFLTACLLVVISASVHGCSLYASILLANGFNLALGNIASMIGLELALIGLVAAINPSLRGISAALLLLAAFAATLAGRGSVPAEMSALLWQIRAHVLMALMAYGLLSVGAIVAIFAMWQERRLQVGKVSALSELFAPLETTERLLFGITAAGFTGLTVTILLGLTFVDNLFAQHLVHKTTFSLLALFVFGTLLAGRFFAGWRGKQAVKLYLGGFALLCMGYFGVRVILEQMLNRSWG